MEDNTELSDFAKTIQVLNKILDLFYELNANDLRWLIRRLHAELKDLEKAEREQVK